MCENKQKTSAFTVLNTNDSGFTFVSLLFTLVIILLSMPIILFLLQKSHVNANEHHISAHQFFVFLYNDTLLSKEVYVKDNQLYYDINDIETAMIEQYQHTVRRRVQGRGHEIYIRNITSFFVTQWEYGFKVKLIMDNGEEYEKKIAYKP